jgi:hypothetical protein
MKALTRILVAAGLVLAACRPGLSQDADIGSFVRQTFIEGIPYEEALRFSRASIPTLLQMLADDGERRHWANVIVMLGIIGDDTVVTPMVSFIEGRASGSATAESFRAREAGLMALGYLVNRTGNQQALDYLIGGMSPEAWDRRGVIGKAPSHANTVERNRDLSRLAILGLALSGTAGAERALRSVQGLPDSQKTRFQIESRKLLDESLRTHGEIAGRGLIEYYRAKRK